MILDAAPRVTKTGVEDRGGGGGGGYGWYRSRFADNKTTAHLSRRFVWWLQNHFSWQVKILASRAAVIDSDGS